MFPTRRIFQSEVAYVLIFLLASACGLKKTLDARQQQAGTINLSRQGLEEIPEEVFERKDLKILRLYGNKIRNISPRIAELTELEELYIGRNQLKELPPEIGRLKKLKILSAQYNDIEALPAEIGEMEQLEQLILNQNRLRTLPPQIGKLQTLKNLQLKYNFLISLPSEIGDCKQLEFVYLNQNRLEALPDSFGKLVSLKELYLAYSGFLVTLPESFCDFRMLEVLEIDGTTAIPPCLLVLRTNRLQIIQR